MNKKLLIIEDNPEHYKLIKSGAELSKHRIHIYEINLKLLIDDLKSNNPIRNIPKDIDLFIIDVSLTLYEDHNELGLKLLLELKLNYEKQFDYIITSIWDKSEFQLITNIEEPNFINKNNHQGFELELKVKHKLNSLWKK